MSSKGLVLLGGEIRYAHFADLPLIAQRGQCGGQLGRMGEQIGPVDLVEVDYVDPEASERCLTGGGDSRWARVVGGGWGDPSLGGQHHPISQLGRRGQNSTQVALGLAESGPAPVEAVHIGGVHQVHAEIQCGLQQLPVLGFRAPD